MSEQPDHTVIQKKPKPVVPDATVVAGKSPTAAAPRKRSVSIGHILKQRFELVELLGSGGMGAVLKARDLRQVEAGDQHPWVALKLINETFSRHEHALVALQQETKKTQRLAHPNIVSVYDFDREGDLAFMTMELLEGQSLDQVLARKPAGLPLADALGMMRQICQAVSYAHKQGIVHADLKPANVFLMKDGRVKILDFGIAQAMQGGSHFDAQVLNALTPAYASVRMLAGERPQAQDDLYALGCIFYLLLTGKHPFQRKRATEADAAGLKAARIPALKSFQWRALQQLLQFQPSAAFSADSFQRAFFNEQADVRRLYQRVGVAAVLVLALVIGVNVYLNRSVRVLANQLVSADAAQVQQAVLDIRALSGSDKVVVLERARDDIAERIEQQLPALETATQFQQLEQYLQQVGSLYPDSSRIQEGISRFDRQREAFVAALATQLQQRVEQRDFTATPVPFAAQVQDLARVAPAHSLLQQDLKSLLAQEAGVAIYLGQRERAGTILAQADQLFPQDAQRFQQIRERLQRTPVSTGAETAAVSASNRQNDNLAAVRALLQDFDLHQNPEQLPAFLQALAQVDAGLHAVIRQGIRDFIVMQQQGGNGKAFAGLHQRLFGATPLLAVAQKPAERQDPCDIRLANQGKQQGRRCRDSLTRSHTGPELVVVKADGIAPFAITRSEISVNDFNLYCTLYRRCTPRAPSLAPLTDIDLQQARFYAQWLSRMTGYAYRLPTLQEWLAAARDDSGVSDHNCIVSAAGRVVRGSTVRPVDQGYANSLGLLNIFGNVEEWVQTDAGVTLVGGGADSPINLCNARYRNDKAPEAAAPFRGLRLVRELKP